jgi:CRISPR-associated protein Csm1
MQLTIRQALYLAGLLHDIGKFGQRANTGTSGLSTQTLSIQGDLCPKYNNNFSHWHVLWTSEYFEKLSSVLPQEYTFDEGTGQTGTLSARHHMTGSLNLPERIIAFADKLSSAQDRRPEDDEASQERARTKENQFRKARLQTIYDFLIEIKKDKKAYHDVGPLRLDDSVFPTPGAHFSEDQPDRYKTLWKAFLDESTKLPKQNFKSLSDSLLSLLRKYTWSIPSSTMDQLDISLYDHLKTTAALSVALYDSIPEHGPLPTAYDALKNAESDKKRFRLMALDFSGIQAFIYQISRKSAAKTLKGRSFYLQLLMDSVIDQILELYELQQGQVLLNSGGKAHILLANRTDLKEKEIDLLNAINSQLNKQFNGKLFLNTESVEFDAGKLTDATGYAGILNELALKLDLAKRRKFSGLLEQDECDFFEPQPLKGLSSEDVCKVTGTDLYARQDEDHVDQKELLFAKRARRRLGDDQDESTISEIASDQIRLGEDLRNARWLIVYRGIPAQIQKHHLFQPLVFNQAMSFVVTDVDYPDSNILRSAIRVEAINDIDSFLDLSSPHVPYASVFRLYGAAWTPVNKEKDRVKEFSEIAADGQADALGILRMDVDGLGIAFSTGFIHQAPDQNPGHLTSISRLSTLSSSLDWFFNGYINTLVRTFESDPVLSTTINQAHDHIYPVYAGGDDLFFVTRWDLAPQLALYIRNQFKKFTHHHSSLSLSGGVAVVDDKTPIHSSAVEAEKMESRAKQYHDDKKDAFTYFGYTLAWQDFEVVLDFFRSIIEINKELDSKSLLGLMRLISHEYNPRYSENIDDKRPYGSWRWRAAYRIARMEKENDVLKNKLAGFSASLITDTHKTYQLTRHAHPEIGLVDTIPLLTRWLHNLTRTSKN